MKRIFFSTLVATGLIVVAVWYFSDAPTPKEEIIRARQAARFQSTLIKARGGDVAAQLAVAGYYKDGIGVKKNQALAGDFYRRAARRGRPVAQYELGRMYETGSGVGADSIKAAEWYRLAAGIGGNRDAQYALGRLYFTGRGVVNNYAAAVKWFRKAANQGHPAALYIMGAVYLEGWSVNVDPIEAYKWFTLALPVADQAMAFDRSYDPARALRRLKAKMNKFQIGRAEEKAALWKPRTEKPAIAIPGRRLLPVRQ
ncbi:MAG TPA: sel1 repeat family protein [Rhodospirillales bacterium]|nr:sel1 repeat family protein [Rhodospirillales bacterium]